MDDLPYGNGFYVVEGIGSVLRVAPGYFPTPLDPENCVKYPDLAYSSTAYISSIELLAQTRVYLFKHGENPVKAFKQGYRAIAKAYESLVAHRQKIDPKLELLYRATSQLEAIRNPSSPEKRIRDIAGKSYLKDLSPKERKDRALRIVVLISDVLNGKKVRSDLLSKSLSDYEIPQRPEELSATLYRQMLSLSKDINSSFSCNNGFSLLIGSINLARIIILTQTLVSFSSFKAIFNL